MSNLKCQVCSFIAIGQIFSCKYSPGLNALSDKTILTSALQNMYRNVNPYLTADSAHPNEFAIENYRRAYCLSVATPSSDTVKSMLVDAYYNKEAITQALVSIFLMNTSFMLKNNHTWGQLYETSLEDGSNRRHSTAVESAKWLAGKLVVSGTTKKTATANLTKLLPLTGLHLFSERVVFGCQDIENNGKPRSLTMSTSHLVGGSQPDNVIVNTVNMCLEKTPQYLKAIAITDNIFLFKSIVKCKLVSVYFVIYCTCNTASCTNCHCKHYRLIEDLQSPVICNDLCRRIVSEPGPQLDNKVKASLLFNGRGRLGQFYFKKQSDAALVRQRSDGQATESNIPIDNIDQDVEDEDLDSVPSSISDVDNGIDEQLFDDDAVQIVDGEVLHISDDTSPLLFEDDEDN